MQSFFSQLRIRNTALYYFTCLNLIGVVVCMLLIQFTNIQLLGINAFIKPFKFFLSTAIFCASMAWITHYLPNKKKVSIYNWVVIIVFVFENSYIFIQAMRGERSHFNISTPFSSFLFILMGVAITIMTVWTAVIGFQFWKDSFPNLSESYVWGIRLGILFFVVFAFAGHLMASLLQHTVGAPDGGPGLPLVNWSSHYGDLRIAHFLGMHALQILPLLGYFLCKTKHSIFLISFVYVIIVITLFIQAMLGHPLIG